MAGSADSSGTKLGRQSKRPPDLPECLPHASPERRAKQIKLEKDARSRKRWRRLAWVFAFFVFTVLGSTAWVVHLNVGLMFNKHAEYQGPVEVFDLVVWHDGRSREFVGTLDEDGYLFTGVDKIWDDEGNLRREAHYKDGCEVSSRSWDGEYYSEVTFFERIPIRGPWDGPLGVTTHVEKLYRNGRPLAVQEFSYFAAHGIYQEFHGNGQVAITGQCKDGKPVGRWEWYDETGNLIETRDSPLIRVNLRFNTLASAEQSLD